MFKSWFSFVLFFLEHNERITLVLKNMEAISMEYDAWFCSHLMESSNSFSVVGTYRISCSLNVAAKYEQRIVYSTFQGWKEQDLPQNLYKYLIISELFVFYLNDKKLVFLKFLWHGDALEQNVFSRFFWSIMLVTNNFKSGRWKLFTALILATISINHFVQTGKHSVLTKMSFFPPPMSNFILYDLGCI